MNEQDKCKQWTSRLLAGLSYAVAIGLTLASPALMGGSLVMGAISGEISVVGFGLLAGALLGAVGAVALIWCLAATRRHSLTA